MAELYDYLTAYGDSGCYPFHMPGHKRNPESGPLKDCYAIDLTEIDGFDNLHDAGGILKEAQERAASLYGAEETFYLVNGSTGGLLSGLASAAERGAMVLIARNCHKSVYHAACLNGWQTDYLCPEWLESWGLPGEIRVQEVERKLKEHPETAAVVLTSPTYDGVVSDVKEIARLVHAHGSVLIVDEAHGAHFGLHREFPPHSVSCGADLVVHSLHKTLPSLTQTALLHVQGERIDRDKLRRFLSIYQSSSPSYLLMASIDSCVDKMSREGERLFEELLRRRTRLCRSLEPCRRIRIMELPDRADGMKCQDPGKLIISVRGAGVNGQRLFTMLRERFGLQMEYAADSYVLAILTVMDTDEGIDRLAKALVQIDAEHASVSPGRNSPGGESAGMPPVPEQRTSIEQAFYSPSRLIPFDGTAGAPCEALGRTAAEYINLYPPGIPLLAPGEKIDQEIVDLIRKYVKMGLPIQGMYPGGRIKIIEERGF